MIKHTELRCGNLFWENYGGYKKVSGIVTGKNGIVSIHATGLKHTVQGSFDPEHIDGVPISEEWLLMAGFIAASDEKRVFFKGRIGYEFGINNYALLMCSDDNGSCVIRLKHIKSLHQLQNLYFDYENEELTFKDL